MKDFMDFVPGEVGWLEPLQSKLRELTDFDGGLYSDDPVAAHAAARDAHANLLVDGNAAGPAETILPLEEHEIDPNAHPDLKVAGTEF